MIAVILDVVIFFQLFQDVLLLVPRRQLSQLWQRKAVAFFDHLGEVLKLLFIYFASQVLHYLHLHSLSIPMVPLFHEFFVGIAQINEVGVAIE